MYGSPIAFLGVTPGIRKINLLIKKICTSNECDTQKRGLSEPGAQRKEKEVKKKIIQNTCQYIEKLLVFVFYCCVMNYQTRLLKTAPIYRLVVL